MTDEATYAVSSASRVRWVTTEAEPRGKLDSAARWCMARTLWRELECLHTAPWSWRRDCAGAFSTP